MASTQFQPQLKAPQKSPDMTGLKSPSTQLQEDNKRKMKANAMSYGTVEVYLDHDIWLFKTFYVAAFIHSLPFLAIPAVNHVPRMYPAAEKPITARQRVNNIPTYKNQVHLSKTGIRDFFYDYRKQSEMFKAVIYSQFVSLKKQRKMLPSKTDLENPPEVRHIHYNSSLCL